MYPRKLNLFIVLTLTTGMASSFAGCRFGNRVESVTNPDAISGYYDMQPQSLKFCATSTQTLCNEAATNLIPAIISSALSNPVALIMQNLDTGKAYFTPPDGNGNSLPIFVGTDNSLSVILATPPEVLWRDSQCTNFLELEESGTLIPAGPGVQTSERSSGRIQLSVHLVTRLDGNCDSTLNDLKSCYLDQSACGGSGPTENENLHHQIQEMFNTYIEANVMTADDIPSIRNLAFEVKYE